MVAAESSIAVDDVHGGGCEKLCNWIFWTKDKIGAPVMMDEWDKRLDGDLAEGTSHESREELSYLDEQGCGKCGQPPFDRLLSELRLVAVWLWSLMTIWYHVDDETQPPEYLLSYACVVTEER
jgi:hypothetical protein